MSTRRGFALSGVLWAITLASVMILASDLAVRGYLRAVQHRTALVRESWAAEGCARSLETIIVESDSAWRTLPDVVARAAPLACHVVLTPAGAGLDPAALDSAQLARAFALHGVRPARADSLVAALLDWLDADTVARAAGAERSWYVAHNRVPPLDRRAMTRAELQGVRGMDDTSLVALFTPEGDPVSLAHVRPGVLLALPGVTPGIATAIERIRHGRDPSWAAVAALLDRAESDTLSAASDWLAVHTSWSPVAWDVVVTASSGPGVPSARLEVRLERLGRHPVAVERILTW